MQCKFCIQLLTKTINFKQSHHRNNSIRRYTPTTVNYHMSRGVSYQTCFNSWSILNDVCRKDFTNHKKYACLLLNICNDDSYKHFEKFRFIWDQANLRIAVDGSVNCLAKRKTLHTAHIVCGDFDSADGKLIERLRNNNYTYDDKQHHMPQVIETPCQQETDFTKALKIATDLKPDIGSFFALYYSDGKRMDHLFALINTLHTNEHQNIIIINVRANTVSWLLKPGEHVIRKQPGQEVCSLVPFMGPAQVETQGLKYNLKVGEELGFGCMISTSNQCLDNCKSILVKTNRKLLWSIDLATPE